MLGAPAKNRRSIHERTSTMSDVAVTLSASTRDEANEIVSLLHCISDELEISVITSKGFIGIGEITLLISAFGGGVLVGQLAKIIVTWMKRHEGHSVKVGKVEIKGYSVEEVERILKVATAE